MAERKYIQLGFGFKERFGNMAIRLGGPTPEELEKMVAHRVERVDVKDIDSRVDYPIGVYNFEDPSVEDDEEQKRHAGELLFRDEMLELERQEKQRNRKLKYKLFLRDVVQRGISFNPNKQVEVKKGMLESYFPGQFSPKKQDLSTHTFGQIGRLFNNLVNYARGL